MVHELLNLLRRWKRQPFPTLAQPLNANRVGTKAANLSQLHAWGYAVPSGWIWRSGDDREALFCQIQPSSGRPVMVRSSAMGEDSLHASAAGQYESIGNVVDRATLEVAIERCLAAYSADRVLAYRRDRGLGVEQPIAVSLLVQRQVRGVLSGVAFSRDPVTPDASVAIEVVAGGAAALVSGQVTPARYSVAVPEAVPDSTSEIPPLAARSSDQAAMPKWGRDRPIEGELSEMDVVDADRLTEILHSIAAIARQLEQRYHGIPQDIEWTYDGDRLWLLQTRPISTLTPIWTRRIAAEVAPGTVHPLAWSISQPLTCGVWGEIFTTVLGDRAAGLDFSQTATLHASHAYFNATLLGEIFLRMGLPPESLEFLMRDRALSRPSFRTLLVNLPGLLRLVGQQFRLKQQFDRDDRATFTPLLQHLATDAIHRLHSPQALLDRVDRILGVLPAVTRYNILVPIDLAIRQKLAGVDAIGDTMPEVQATRAMQALAHDLRDHCEQCGLNLDRDHDTDRPAAELRSQLEPTAAGRELLAKFAAWLDRYGYLSDVGTNIAVPTWSETPDRWLQLWWQTAQSSRTPPDATGGGANSGSELSKNNVPRSLRDFAQLKGRVAEVYDRLLAELRWCFVAIDHHARALELWGKALEPVVDLAINSMGEPVNEPVNRPAQPDTTADIFWLTVTEVRQLLNRDFASSAAPANVDELIRRRREQFDRDRQRNSVPRRVYGDTIPTPSPAPAVTGSLSGIAASRGQVRGRILPVLQFDPSLRVDRRTILVVPYTDAGWSPLLAQAGGLISAVGGRLSHGAIVAREYGIPAVMDVATAFEQLRSGQWVELDGDRGTITLLPDAAQD